VSGRMRIDLPLTRDKARSLRAGQVVELYGEMYTARDAAHKRLADLIESGGELPVDLADMTIYYVGPTPAPPGAVIGSAGPTSSYLPCIVAQDSVGGDLYQR